MTYSDKLKSPKWQKKRLEILNRDEFTCQCCGDNESNLQVHHKKYIYGKDIWDYDNSLLITFCEPCHGLATDLNKAIKDVIAEYFDSPDYLEELLRVLNSIKGRNPYELMMISKKIKNIKIELPKKIKQNDRVRTK